MLLVAACVNWQGTKMNGRSGQFTRGKSHIKLTRIFPENNNLTTPKGVQTGCGSSII